MGQLHIFILFLFICLHVVSSFVCLVLCEIVEYIMCEYVRVV